MLRTVLVLLTSFVAVVVPIASPVAQTRRASPPRPETPSMELPTRSIASILRIGEVKGEIGREEEDGPHMFGTIEWPALGGDGTVYIAEFATGQIRAFDQRGNHLSTFGRKGRGPGEFVNPIALWHDGDSTLFASQLNFGVTEIATRGGRMSYRRTFGAGANYGSFCALGPRLFASVGGDSGIVVELDAKREIIGRFGTLFFPNDTPAVRKLANQGGPWLLCDAPSSTIYATRTDLGVIRRYDAAGTLKWESTLPSFQHSIFGGGGGSAFVAWSVDYIASLVPVGRSRILAVVARRDFASTRGRSRAQGSMIVPDVAGITAYELDAATGRVLAKVRGAAEYMRLSDSLVAERVTDPYPMARLRAVRAVNP